MLRSLREVGPDPRYLIQYRDQASGWRYEELLFNSCHGTKYISSPKCPYRLWASLTYYIYVVVTHGSFSNRGLHLHTRRHLLVPRTRRCGSDPPLPHTFMAIIKTTSRLFYPYVVSDSNQTGNTAVF